MELKATASTTAALASPRIPQPRGKSLTVQRRLATAAGAATGSFTRALKKKTSVWDLATSSGEIIDCNS